MKTVSLRLLHDNGLLFEINRRVLHPLGLALSLNWDNEDASGEPKTVSLLRTEDKDGIVFTPETFLEGESKLLEFIRRSGGHQMAERGAILGFIEQESPGDETPKALESRAN